MPRRFQQGFPFLFFLTFVACIRSAAGQTDTLYRIRIVSAETSYLQPIDSSLLDLLNSRRHGRWLITSEAETGAGAATAVRTPFWLRVNQYGTIPLTSPAGWLRFRTSGQTQPRPGAWRRAGRSVLVKYAVEVAGMAAVPSYADRYRLLLVELYGQVRWRRWEIYAGQRRDIFGLVDSTLSSGSFSWSGNAVPLPRVQIGTWNYVPFPLVGKWLAFNAMYAHAWFGSTNENRNFYLHQKALFFRVGKPNGAFRAYMGMTHYAQWGGQVINTNATLTPDPQGYLPATFKDYTYVVLARQPPAADSAIYGVYDGPNRVGNHLGTMDAALDWTDQNGAWMAYMQHPFEDKSGLAWANWPDGLYGIRWQRQRPVQQGRISLTRVTFEGLSTTDQSLGAVRRGLTQYDPNDNYFNNGQYVEGWTYKDHSIGTPALTRRLETTPFWQTGTTYRDRSQVISGNAAKMIYLGMMGSLPNGWPFRLHLSQAWYDPDYLAPHNPPRSIPQTSGSLDVTIPWRALGGSEIRAAVAFDAGSWLRNSVGGQVRLLKRW